MSQQPFSVAVTATDPNKGDLISLSCGSDVGSWKDIANGSGAWRWTPPLRSKGTRHTVTCVANDAYHRAGDSVSFLVTVQ